MSAKLSELTAVDWGAQSNHPRNMCADCGFMSEHMYVMRRHLQRHTTAGCECQICGRRYKVSAQWLLSLYLMRCAK